MTPRNRIACLTVLLAMMFVILAYQSELIDFDDPENVKILFIGNSLITTDDVPKIVADIAKAKNKKVTIDTAAFDGAKLADHLKSNITRYKIRRKKWDYIILQEQSQRPALDNIGVEQEFFAPARQLVRYIHEHSANTRILFYETWGYKQGDQWSCRWVPGNCTYDGMQFNLIDNYNAIAEETNSGLAPVGEVWQQLLASHPEIEPFGPDGIHPSPAGAYIAAATTFHAIFREPVAGAPAISISEKEAAAIQQAVDQMPLNSN